MIRKEETIKVGTFTRPHGIKGELSLVTDYDLFDEVDDPYIICEMDGILVPFYVESFRTKSRAGILVKLAEVDSVVAAKEFVNREVFYPVKHLKEASTDDLTWKRFTGYTLIDKIHGELGLITHVDDTTMNTLFTVDYRSEALLIPFADELVDSIDHEGKKIVMLLPEGILQIN